MTDKTDSKEREAFIEFLLTFPRSYTREIAEHYWDHEHVSALYWKAGRASLAASAGSEPVAAIHWPIGGPPRLMWHSNAALHTAIRKAHEGHQSDVPLYTHPSPPEGMVGGWIASKDQMPPPGVRVFWGDADSNRVGYDSWAGDDYRWAPSHWMHIPEFRAPPTSSADSGKGE